MRVKLPIGAHQETESGFVPAARETGLSVLKIAHLGVSTKSHCIKVKATEVIVG